MVSRLRPKSYPVRYVTPQFQKFAVRRGNTQEYAVRFLDSMEAHPNNADLCVSELFKLLKDRAYTWYVNLKPKSMHDWENPFSLFNKIFLRAEAKYRLAELSRKNQYPGEDFSNYMKRFNEKALYCCDSVAEDVL